jgi:hypothetical protein
MKRHTAGAFCSLVAAFTLMATAGPASAAPLQDFNLTSNNGVRVATAQGAIATGVGTFTQTGPTSETILIGGEPPIFMTQTPVTHVESVDPRTCRATVVEKGTFEFSQQDGDTTFGGSGPYTLAGTRQGQRVGTGCTFSSPTLTQFNLTAKATEIHAVA